MSGLSRRTFLQLCSAGALAGGIPAHALAQEKTLLIDSPAGRRRIDTQGAPVGVVRMETARSYAGIGELLQRHINDLDEAAWREIRTRIDYTFDCLEFALGSLETETGFRKTLQPHLEAGRKLLFKPNLVGMIHIDPQTHGPGMGNRTNTEWAFVAALMRWFHDRLDVSYHRMALGEASTCMPMASGLMTRLNGGKEITPECAIEGRNGGFYGGWGFYFVRKYLAETLKSGSKDDPFQGYDESLKGIYLPPGKCSDKLMVYDLNQTEGRARLVPVPGGVNYRSVMLHKAIVGGAPDDREDRAAYPGCVLVNVPKFKVHAITLMTNVIKNLGIGLYPMQSARKSKSEWDYSLPHGSMPGMKGLLPHQIWVSQMDPRTGAPKRDESGKYLVEKTGGINATMMDVIKAVQGQGTTMIHVVDGIEAINLDHTGPGEKVGEGMIFAGLDPVATDLLCARYMFSNVPLKEALETNLEDGFGGRFPQRVPLPAVERGEIVTRTGYDCPISRDRTLKNAEARGLGKPSYYVVGRDIASKSPLASVEGHLGRISGGKFEDVVTRTLYYDLTKMPWDLQATAFAWFKASDRLTGSSRMKTFLEEFDEDGDEIVSYDEFGRNGVFGPALFSGGRMFEMIGTENFGFLKGPFVSSSTLIRWSNPAWNPDRHDIIGGLGLATAAVAALRMSQAPNESPDPVHGSLRWGGGKWPSYDFASQASLMSALFGKAFPAAFDPGSLYGLAFTYADLTQNQGKLSSSPEGAAGYWKKVGAGSVKPLDFVFYVPREFEIKLPNVEQTTDPAKIFTAGFRSGKEVWS